MTRFDLTRRDLIQLGGYGLLASGCLTAQPAAGAGSDGAPLYLPTSSGGSSGVRFANAPEWFREAPGIFVPNPLSAGAGMLYYTDPPNLSLRNQIHSFTDLPTLVEQARSIGTNIVYLMDWGDGSTGDYIPNTQMGGETALQAGIASAHKAGGRIILYVEGLLAAHSSKVGAEHGAEWSIIAKDGKPLANPYPQSWKMCPATEGWASYLEGLATRLASYGADGIYFDDWGDPEEFPCYSKMHGHPVGGAHVYNNGQIACAKRVRAALQKARPGMVMLTEDPIREGLFEYIDGSLDWGLFSFVTRWVWNAQGQTDTFLPSMSIDDWHQTAAIGAKFACPHQFLDAPPPPSATALLNNASAKLNANNLLMLSKGAVWGLHQWRNAGVMLGLPMPGLGDIAPQEGNDVGPLPKTEDKFRQWLALALPHATSIDAALAGKTPPSSAAYLKTLLNARRALARVIDHGSSVTRVEAGSPNVVGWSFSGGAGTALTAVSVDDAPQSITFSNAAGGWQDQITNERFFAKGATLTVPIPAHRVRLLLPIQGLHIPPKPNPKNLPKI